jgi:hypothetical protein
MELAQYYGGAPSGGAFSGGMMNPMYYGGARKPIEQNRLFQRNPDYYNCAIENWKTRASRCSQFVKPKRVPTGRRLVKGSPEALAYMANLRAVRGTEGRAPKRANKGSRTCRIQGQSFTVAELKRAAKSMKIAGYSKMKKAELCREVNASLMANVDTPF